MCLNHDPVSFGGVGKSYAQNTASAHSFSQIIQTRGWGYLTALRGACIYMYTHTSCGRVTMVEPQAILEEYLQVRIELLWHVHVHDGRSVSLL